MQNQKHRVGLLARLVTAVAALALALAGVLGPTSAYATNSFTMKMTGAPKGRTYEAYQIFKGTASGNTLSNVEWGDDIKDNSAALLAALKADTRFVKDGTNIFTAANTAADVADALGTASNGAFDDTYAKAFADVAGAFATTDGTSTYTYLDGTPTKTFTDDGDGTYTAADVPGGFYLIGDKLGSVADNAYVTRYVTQVSGANGGTINIQVKVDTPENKKEIINNGQTSKWQNAGVGDTVSYRLTGSIPTNLANYKTYAYKFVDTMSKGLTFNKDSVVVKVGTNPTDAKVVSSGSYTLTYGPVGNTDATYPDGTKITVAFANLKTITDTSGQAIDPKGNVYVEYTAKVNEKSVVVNPNESHIEFSNNPNGSGEGKTPDDKTVVFTYEGDVSKVDKKDQSSLAGAQFFLTRTENGVTQAAKMTSTTTQDGATIYQVTEWVNWPSKPADTTDDEWTARDGNVLTKEEAAAKAAGATLITAPSDGSGKGKFNILGLDADRDYALHEAITPNGYNRLASDITFSISSTVTQQTDGSYKITGVSGKVNGQNQTGTVTDGQDGTTQTASLPVKVENGKGSGLPSTGGAGTVAFVAVGLGLMAAAGIAFARARQRDRTNE